mmetsp:Transcript_8463/g.20327  ORF Transcript_8463/g.20327 Transcript_8463/m.20327 type:complete len:101 (+) Transcript_8463:428-730(+)
MARREAVRGPQKGATAPFSTDVFLCNGWRPRGGSTALDLLEPTPSVGTTTNDAFSKQRDNRSTDVTMTHAERMDVGSACESGDAMAMPMQHVCNTIACKI